MKSSGFLFGIGSLLAYSERKPKQDYATKQKGRHVRGFLNRTRLVGLLIVGIVLLSAGIGGVFTVPSCSNSQKGIGHGMCLLDTTWDIVSLILGISFLVIYFISYSKKETTSELQPKGNTDKTLGDFD